MKFKVKGARLAGLLVPALALAVPAFAQVRDPTLGDATEPGSVIVFPKFINGPGVVLPEGAPAPVTELEIGVAHMRGRIADGFCHQPGPNGVSAVAALEVSGDVFNGPAAEAAARTAIVRTAGFQKHLLLILALRTKFGQRVFYRNAKRAARTDPSVSALSS